MSVGICAKGNGKKDIVVRKLWDKIEIEIAET